MARIEIKDLEIQEETSERASIEVEIFFENREVGISVLKDGSYEHFVDVAVDYDSGEVILRERSHNGVYWDPENLGRRFYRSQTVLFNSSFDFGKEESEPNDQPPVQEPVSLSTRMPKPVTDTSGAVFSPWTDGHAIGFMVAFPNKPTEYIYFNPSSDPDGGNSNVFLYHGPHGDPSLDSPDCRYSVGV